MFNLVYQRFKKDLSLIILRFLGVAFLFLLSLLLTNYYPIETVGDFEYARNILLFLSALGLMGTERSILKFAGQLRAKDNESGLFNVYYKSIFISLSACLGLLILFFIFPKSILISILGDEKTYIIFFKIFILMFFYCLTELNTEMLRALGKMKIAELFRGALRYVLLLLFTLILLAYDKTDFIIDFFLINFVIVGLVTSAYIFKLKPSNSKVAENYISTKKIVKTAFPMAISSVSIFLLFSIDFFLLRRFTSSTEIAIYAQPFKLMMLTFVVMNTIQVAIGAEIALLHTKGQLLQLNLFIKSNTRRIVLLSLPIVLILGLFPEFFLSIFGTQYIEGKNILRIIILGATINILTCCTVIYMNMTGKQRVLQVFLMLAVLINLGINVLLIPRIGGLGAAIAFTVATVFWNIATVIYVYKKDRVVLLVN